MVGLYTMERCVLVRLVVGGFELVSLPRHCWEGSVVDHLLMVGCCLDSWLSYLWLSLVGFVGMVGWDGFAMQTLDPKLLAELGWGLEWLALVVHSRLRGLGVLQTWASVPHNVVPAK